MKEKIVSVFNNSKNKKILIFFGVFIFVIQSLISIILFSVNFPISDDWPAVFTAFSYYEGNSNWYDIIFGQRVTHFLFFYRIVMVGGFLLNSFNVQQFMFLNWGFLSISLGIFYFILKKTNEQFVWLLIPIAAFVFSPKMVSTNFTASIGLVWIGTFFFLVCVVGILHKQKLTSIWFVIAICLSIVATFNSILGLLTWIIGILCLIPRFKQNKEYLVVWITISLIIFAFYILYIELDHGPEDFLKVFSLAGIGWGLEYVSNPFSVLFTEFRLFIGIISISALIIISYFLLKKQISSSVPWIMF